MSYRDSFLRWFRFQLSGRFHYAGKSHFFLNAGQGFFCRFPFGLFFHALTIARLAGN